MGKFKGNVFWVFMAAVLLAELCIYLLPVPGTVSRMKRDHTSRLEELETQKGELERARQPGNSANEAMIEAAEKRKAQLNGEYLKMCLLLIGKDDMIDRYFDIGTKIPATKRLNLTPSERTLLLDQILNARTACAKAATDAGIQMDAQQLPWDWVKIEGEAPSPTILVYAHKQVYIQRKLMDVMTMPSPTAEAKKKGVEAKEAPKEAAPAADANPPAPPAADAGVRRVRIDDGVASLAILFNKIAFKTPERREDLPFDPRYVYYTVSLDVSMLPENVPYLIEGITNCGLPLTITSFTIERGMGGGVGPGAAARVQTGQTLVTVKVDCKVLDFSGAISKVEFAREQFQKPADVENYLKEKEQQDPLIKALATEMAKGSSAKEPEDPRDPILYEIYGDMLNSEPVKCELEKGITVHFGTIEHNVPDLLRR